MTIVQKTKSAYKWIRDRSPMQQIGLAAGGLLVAGAAVAGGISLFSRNADATQEPEENLEEKAASADSDATYSVQDDKCRSFDMSLSFVETDLAKISEEGYTRDELDSVLATYEKLQNIGLPEGADAYVKGHYQKVLTDFEEIIDDAFNASDVFAYVGIDNWRQERKNAGGSKPLFVGKGADIKQLVDRAQKIELLKKSRKDWEPYTVKERDGSYFISKSAVYDTSVPVKTEQFKKILEARKNFGNRSNANESYLDMQLWQDLTNGDLRDAEICTVGPDGEYTRLSAVYSGHSDSKQ